MNSESLTDNPVLLLRDASRMLRAEPGEIILLKGDVGSGKTTWLKIIAGIADMPSHINVRIEGKPPGKAPERIRMLFDRQPPLWLGQNVAEELGFGLKEQPSTQIIDETLSEWGLGTLHPDTSLSTLNRLQAAHLSLAAMALAKPKIVLLDNPTDALTRNDAVALGCQLADWAKKTNTAVVVACNRWHDWQPVASQIWHVTGADLLPQPGGQA